MDVFLSVLRTVAQALVGYLVAQLAVHGLEVPEAVQAWLRDVVLVAGGAAAVTAAVRWLETRTGHGPAAQLARKLARVLMLGLGGGKPVYVRPGDVVRVGHAGAVHRR